MSRTVNSTSGGEYARTDEEIALKSLTSTPPPVLTNGSSESALHAKESPLGTNGDKKKSANIEMSHIATNGKSPASANIGSSSSYSSSSASTSSTKRDFRESPEVRANWFSRRFYWWMNQLMSQGSKFVLMESDLYQVSPEIEARQLTQRFDEEWKVELEKEKETKATPKPHAPSTLAALTRIFQADILIGGVCLAINVGLTFLQPILLEWILKFIIKTQYPELTTTSGEPPPAWHGYAYAAAIGLTPFLQTIFNNAHTEHMMKVGLKSRTILVTQLYKKALRLSPESKQSMSTGQIVNMMSTDATKIDGFTGYAHWTWSTVAQIIIATALLIRAIGPPALAGIGVIILLFPLQGKIIYQMGLLKNASVKITDQRIKLMNEILQGIRVIKVYAYENSFLQKMYGIRTDEMTYVKKSAYQRSYNFAILSITPILMSLLAFVTVGLAKNSFEPEYIFQAVVLFEILRLPLLFLPMILAMAVDTNISLQRIDKFLKAGELEWSPEQVQDRNIAVRVEAANFTWTAVKEEEAAAAFHVMGMKSKSDDKKTAVEADAMKKVTVEKVGEKATAGGKDAAVVAAASDASSGVSPEAKIEVLPFHLDNVYFSLPHGSLTIVVGGVGSGKSSLLAGILGEMKRVSGSVKLSGSVGYCPQQAWIQNATLKENILFGLPFDQVKYDDAIKYSALQADIDVLPAKDLTEIGEKGINLSGGQKQRVNLARAIYFDADIVMFDDPLSAVDAHVSKYLFSECIQKKLKDKTRLLVTHQLQYVSSCDHVLFVEDGKITESGSYTQLMAKKGNFFTLMSTYVGEEDEASSDASDDEKQSEEGTTTTTKRTKGLKTAKSSASVHKTSSAVVTTKKDSVLSEAELKKQQAEKDASKQLIQAEERQQGNVPLKTYTYYLKHAGGWWITFACILLCLQTGAAAWSTWWLNYWTSDKFNRDTYFYLGIYAAIGVSQTIAALICALVVAHTGTIAAHQLHNASFRSVMHAPMSFFDTTPIGRIINRFSKDQSILDDALMDMIRSFLYMLCSILATFILIAYVTPWFLLPCVPVMIGYWFVQGEFRKTSREVKRLESITRGPLYAHFSETLTGLSTIRAYQAQNTFIETNQKRMDANNRAYYLQVMIQRWLAIRIETVGALISFSAALILIIQRNSISASEAGVSLSYATSVTSLLTWFVQQMAAVENNMNSVERAIYYTNEIAQEAPATIAEKDEPLKTTWPREGAIEFNDLKIRYRDNLPLVLHGISLSIRGGERIGVVGRTGAGKSSLMVALFRLVEAVDDGGRISIDGIDISKIGLDALRNKLAIIPQDAVLYSGTIRSNLDPFSKYTDAELWSALEKSHLKDVISALEKKLLDPISEGGENFSVGQRCQICLARAILRNAKILIMDEATASVDMATDAYIQNSLRKNFNCTLLTIAHRLNTIVDYDRVLVLSFGRVQEFDSPANLLRNPNSAFSAMVNETGEVNAALLRSIAFKAEKGIRVDAADLLAVEGAELIGSPSNVLASNQQQQQSSTIQTSPAAAIDYLPVEPFLEVSRNHPSYSHVNWHDGEDDEYL